MTGRNVYVVDDEEPIRGALKMMLGVQGFSATLFASGRSFLDVADALVPGCVLLDLRMPDIDGLEVQRLLVDRRDDIPVVMMTGHGDLGVASTALRNGAVGFVEKPFARATLRRALDAAFLKLEDPARYEALIAQSRQSLDALEEEDRRVLSQLAAGRSNELIAADLEVSTAAVEVRRARLFLALGIDSVNEAVTIAFAAGLRS
jgi:two-component system response regulator FixJ